MFYFMSRKKRLNLYSYLTFSLEITLIITGGKTKRISQQRKANEADSFCTLVF